MAHLTIRPSRRQRVVHAPSDRRRFFGGVRRSVLPDEAGHHEAPGPVEIPVQPRPAPRPGYGEADPAEAEEFLRQYHRERANRAGPLMPRLREMHRSIAETGTYTHTPAELTYGA